MSITIEHTMSIWILCAPIRHHIGEMMFSDMENLEFAVMSSKHCCLFCFVSFRFVSFRFVCLFVCLLILLTFICDLSGANRDEHISISNCLGGWALSSPWCGRNPPGPQDDPHGKNGIIYLHEQHEKSTIFMQVNIPMDPMDPMEHSHNILS